jgi:soluble lytic murein transglycosylase-like protein
MIRLITFAILIANYLKKKYDEAREIDSYMILYPVSTNDVTSIVLNHKKQIIGAGIAMKVDPALISSIIEHESEGISNKIRKSGSGVYFGLMQIGLSTAINLGYGGLANDLLDPKRNVDLGTQYLAYFIKRFKSIDKSATFLVTDVIQGYRSGWRYRKTDGTYRNQSYVDAVLESVPKYRLAFSTIPDYEKQFPGFLWYQQRI